MTNVESSPFKGSFLESSLEIEGINGSLTDFLDWYSTKFDTNQFNVKEVPFDNSDQWRFTKEGKLGHHTGKFFTIEGLKVKTDLDGYRSWEQIIINQPEIGILGIITKVFNGVRHFLMQAKMEPGNINILQLSPTLQATRSNYKLVHKGRVPTYLEYFIDRTKAKIIVDQVQTEQGGRFLKKRNRNMIVEVDEELELHEDFYWLTLGQLKRLHKHDNLVNMDSRSVIACIPLINEIDSYNRLENNTNYPLLKSLFEKTNLVNSFDDIISWYSGLITEYNVEIEKVPLSSLKNWEVTNDEIKHKFEDRFSAILVDVLAENREVARWNQPLIKDLNIGLIGFLIKEFDGVLHFLVQAKLEPGNIDKFELCPTVSVSNYQHQMTLEHQIFGIQELLNASENEVLVDQLQSEEGGRFYHLQNRNMVVKVDAELELPENYIWMSLGQIMHFLKLGRLNIEGRSVIACLDFTQKL